MNTLSSVRMGASLLVMLAALAFTATGFAATAAAPVNTSPPTISGTAQVGQTLTAGNGTWSNAPTSFAYQWLRCNGGGNSCDSVANATQQTYTLVAADVGSTMRVRVTATNADGSNAAQSEQTAVVAPVTSSAAPKNTSPPTIAGTAKVGQTLTANEGTWSGNPTGYAFQWQRCDADVVVCSNVVGATAKTYLVRIADLGYRLRVRVTARNDKGSATANSALLGDRRPGNSDHQQAANPDDPVRSLRRRPGVCPVPDLRRLVQERDDHPDRLAAGEALLYPAIHDACAAPPLWRLYPALASGAPLPRAWEVHRHPSRPRQVRADEPSRSPHVQPLGPKDNEGGCRRRRPPSSHAGCVTLRVPT